MGATTEDVVMDTNNALNGNTNNANDNLEPLTGLNNGDLDTHTNGNNNDLEPLTARDPDDPDPIRPMSDDVITDGPDAELEKLHFHHEAPAYGNESPRYLEGHQRGRASKFFINGDKFFPAKKIVYNPKHFKVG